MSSGHIKKKINKKTKKKKANHQKSLTKVESHHRKHTTTASSHLGGFGCSAIFRDVDHVVRTSLGPLEGSKWQQVGDIYFETRLSARGATVSVCFAEGELGLVLALRISCSVGGAGVPSQLLGSSDPVQDGAGLKEFCCCKTPPVACSFSDRRGG